MSMKPLVLHFDINGTITAIDTTEPGTKEECANMVIAKSVYGKIQDNKWILDKTGISYYDHLKGITKDYKKKSFTFTNKNEPGETLNYLVPKLIESMDTFLFQSFLNVLEKYDCIIILRTFGNDIDESIKGLSKNFIKGEFSYINEERPLITLENGQKISEIHNLNKYILDTKSNLALKEDYNFWNNNDRDKRYGKQLLGNESMIQIFFDDNDCVNVLDDLNCHFVQINTLEALTNDNYYTDIIDKIIKNCY